MLILHTARLEASLNSFSGIPIAFGSAPPFSLMIFTNACVTEEDPCKTIGNPGNLLDTSSKMSNLSGGGVKTPLTNVHCSGLNLYAP